MRKRQIIVAFTVGTAPTRPKSTHAVYPFFSERVIEYGAAVAGVHVSGKCKIMEVNAVAAYGDDGRKATAGIVKIQFIFLVLWRLL